MYEKSSQLMLNGNMDVKSTYLSLNPPSMFPTVERMQSLNLRESIVRNQGTNVTHMSSV